MSSGREVDVAEIIDRGRISGLQYTALALVGVVALIDGFDTQSIAFVVPAIAREWGLDVASFGPVFAASTLGLALGAIIAGPLADRFGRKTVLIYATLEVGLASLICATAGSYTTLLIYRLLIGLGLGAGMPCIIALAAEFTPARRRATVVSLISCAYPAGAMLGGAASTKLIPELGWQAVFNAGGVLPLLMVPLLIWLLPESLAFLAARKKKDARVWRMLRSIDPQGSYGEDDRLATATQQRSAARLSGLFTEGRANATVSLWVVFFCNLLVVYFLVTWLPSVMQQAGLPTDKAILPSVLLNAGAILGGLVLGRTVDNNKSFGILPAVYVTGAVMMVALGMLLGQSLLVLGVAAFAAGFAVMGAMFCMHPLAAVSYPASVRSTGLGAALGIGRVGSIVGPLLGGILLSLKWTAGDVFFLCAVPLAVAAVAVYALTRLRSAPVAAQVREAA